MLCDWAASLSPLELHGEAWIRLPELLPPEPNGHQGLTDWINHLVVVRLTSKVQSYYWFWSDVSLYFLPVNAPQSILNLSRNPWTMMSCGVGHGDYAGGVGDGTGGGGWACQWQIQGSNLWLCRYADMYRYVRDWKWLKSNLYQTINKALKSYLIQISDRRLNLPVNLWFHKSITQLVSQH